MQFSRMRNVSSHEAVEDEEEVLWLAFKAMGNDAYLEPSPLWSSGRYSACYQKRKVTITRPITNPFTQNRDLPTRYIDAIMAYILWE